MNEWTTHDGMGCPLSVGTRYEGRNLGGIVFVEIVDETAHRLDVIEMCGQTVISAWAWACFKGVGEMDEAFNIIAYRVIGKSDEERRAENQALFESWLTPAPVRVPEQVGG